jgi:hypothetical protein
MVRMTGGCSPAGHLAVGEARLARDRYRRVDPIE